MSCSAVTLPDAGRATFQGYGILSIHTGTASGSRASFVVDAEGNGRVYDFGACQVEILHQWADMLWPSSDTRRIPLLAYYVSMNVVFYEGSAVTFTVHSDGTVTYSGPGQVWQELFNFDRQAGMALSSVTDGSGNQTSYMYGDAFSDPTGMAPFSLWSDPTQESRQWDSGMVTKTFAYGVYRIMSQSVDEEGRITNYALDSMGRRLSETIYAPGASSPTQVTVFAYDSGIAAFVSGHTVQTLSGDPSWAVDLVKTYAPDGAGRVAQEVVNPFGLSLTTNHTYDANGNKLSTQDPNGHFTYFTYDDRNRLTLITDEGPGSRTFDYDAAGNKISETDQNNHSTLFEYDALNRVITQTRVMTPDPDLVTQFEYNHLGSKTSIEDPNGNVTEMDYDALQRLVQTTDALHQTTQYEYDTADNPGASAFETSKFKPTTIIDPRLVATQMHYDSLYHLRTKSVEYSPGLFSTVQINTDAVGNVIEEIDPLGHIVQKTYDALNRLTVTTWLNDDPANPSGPPIASTEQHFYTSTGLAHQVMDELGNVTDMVCDGAGRPTQVIGPAVDNGTGTLARPVHQIHHDNNGNISARIDPLNNETDFEYDVRNRKTLEIRPEVFDAISGTNLQPQLQWVYDNVGNVVATIDERNNRTDYTFDPNNRRTKVEAPEVSYGPSGTTSARPTTNTTYDPNGNALQVTDPNGNTTVNTYDPLNRLHTTTNGAGDTVTYTYDPVGNRLTVKDGLSQITAMTYDGLNRLLTTTDFAGKVTTLAYDALNKVTRTDAASQVTNYTYNLRNRLYQTLHVGRSVDDQTFTYDFIGKILTVSEPGKSGAADVTYTYDVLHRVTTETSSGQTHAYLYDLSDNRVKATYGGTGRVVTSTYDAINRLSTMVEGGRTTGYVYDLHGNLVTQTHANGETVNETHDPLNRATQIEGQKPSGAGLLYRYIQRYDLASNVVFIHEDYSQPMPETYREITQEYDGANRLTLEQYRDDTGGTPSDHGGNRDVTHVYDAADNRGSKTVHYLTDPGPDDTYTFTYNNLNQLTTLAISKPARFGHGAVSQTKTYTYDLNGNRHSTSINGGLGPTYSYDYDQRLISGLQSGHFWYLYTYDYRTRRVEITDRTTNTSTVVSFSGGSSVQESVHGTVNVEYIRGSDMGGGIGGILYTLRSGNPSYTHYNSRGDVVAKTDASNAVTYQATYDAFGTRPEEVGSTPDRQKANTKDEDPTGLLNEGFRYRDLESNVFITRDPNGFADGPNLYTYVHQNPWTHFDPHGLDTADNKPLSPPPNTEWHKAIPEMSARTADRNQAVLAEGSYHPKEGGLPQGQDKNLKLPKNWVAVQKAELKRLHIEQADLHDEDKSGFSAEVYRNTMTGKYALAFRGTLPTSAASWKANFGQGFGFETKQYDRAISLAQKMVMAVGQGNVTMVGHSLGGGLATAAALVTQTHAVTFNAASVSSATLARFGANATNAKSLIHAYHTAGEPLTAIQAMLSVTLAPLLRVASLGMLHPIGTAQGTRITLDRTVPIYHPLDNHGMDNVIRSMTE